jgi:hypothetical protein
MERKGIHEIHHRKLLEFSFPDPVFNSKENSYKTHYQLQALNDKVDGVVYSSFLPNELYTYTLWAEDSKIFNLILKNLK